MEACPVSRALSRHLLTLPSPSSIFAKLSSFWSFLDFCKAIIIIDLPRFFAKLSSFWSFLDFGKVIIILVVPCFLQSSHHHRLCRVLPYLVYQLDDLSSLNWDLCIDLLYLQHPEKTKI